MVIEDAAQCTMAFDLVYQSPRPEPGLCVCVPTDHDPSPTSEEVLVKSRSLI